MGKNETIELIEDLLDPHETNPDTEYFLGSIVFVRKSGSPMAEVVDGHQRLRKPTARSGLTTPATSSKRSVLSRRLPLGWELAAAGR